VERVAVKTSPGPKLSKREIQFTHPGPAINFRLIKTPDIPLTRLVFLPTSDFRPVSAP
jgi:hypothetical protein